RNALIELVTEFHQDTVLPAELRPKAFVVAYAGALVLVDAARFLRDSVHDRPIVRGKLNEAEPHFGIPLGTYDTIQRSLTSPVHAWHLYHAMQYVSSQQVELKKLAADPDFAALLEMIDRLQQRMQVRIEEYAIARVRSDARLVSTSVRRDMFTRALY